MLTREETNTIIINNDNQYIGEKVKILSNARGTAADYKGRVVTIIRLQGNLEHHVVIAKIGEVEFNLITPLRENSGEFELYNEKNTDFSSSSTQRQFAIGDKVVVLSENIFNRSSLNLTKVYILYSIDICDNTFKIGENENSGIWCRKIRLATLEEIEANCVLSNPISSETIILPTPEYKLPIYTGFKAEVLDCLLNHPEKLPILKATCQNRKYFDKIINSFLPFKIGMEVECIGSLSEQMEGNDYFDNEKMATILDCFSFSDNRNNYQKEKEMCENRICFNGHKQVIALSRFCALLSQHCIIDELGGIHYHFDFPEVKLLGEDSHLMQEIKKACETKLDKIDYILQYKGFFNPKIVKIDSKPCWINIRKYFGTIEIRIAGPKFDYKKILTEIIALSNIILEIRKNIKLSQYRLKN